ncbi:MAG: S41 family peptidase [Bacteroidetes bacterium]|nr:S41 family peptidase [Bacteroidota bacterium]MBK7108252.1 S41 family peptidase [Bacteroidota bacterium]MBK8683106.1 S41 family peptidase [Bacteroidota bacterium]MBP8753044.1 S41 family peptidase [Chitinophagales bacterium]MBP9703517.1 S41 family peptidase [Chitinophagales bacterium]
MLTQLKKRVVIISVAISATIILSAAAVKVDLFEVSKNIDIFTTIYKELNTYYVDEIDPNTLMRTGIDAMLESLDPYTNYISEAELEGYKFQVTGNYGGIGATIRPVDGKITVIDTHEGFPAFNAGLRPGFIITEIDGKATNGKNNEEISEFLRGSPGSTVSIKYTKPFDDQEYQSTIVREEIKMENVPYYGMVTENIGYIILTQFTENSGRNVESALRMLKQDHPELSGVILDLRGNPGGLLREAVNVSNVFVDKGVEIVSTKGKVTEWDKVFTSLNAPLDKTIPLVVLTSRSSASASEIVAGVIQDYDRGIVVGQKSYGKGLVQTTRDISYKTKLKLTTAKYYIPSGRCIQAIDYAHRNEDGSLGKMPDSLKTAFKTASGRVVYDGGGIDPDITVPTETYKDITISLITKDIIFNYATLFQYEHPEITDARNFSLTDAQYEDFVKYLADKDYDYVTETELQLSEFEASAVEDQYFDAIKSDIDNLKTLIHHNKETDLYKFKNEILYELNKEIVGRYYQDVGRIELSFNYDPDIQEAVRVLNELERYEALLKPSK